MSFHPTLYNLILVLNYIFSDHFVNKYEIMYVLFLRQIISAIF